MELIENTKLFSAISIIGQIFGGTGTGFICTISFAIISSFDQSEREKIIGYYEGAYGLGLLIGPILGALLYELGGFSLPFLFFGCFYLIFYPIVTYIFLAAEKKTLFK